MLSRRFRHDAKSDKCFTGSTIACTFGSSTSFSSFWVPGKLRPTTLTHRSSTFSASTSRASSGDDELNTESWSIKSDNNDQLSTAEDRLEYSSLLYDFDATYCLLKAKNVRMPLPISTLIPFTAFDNLNAFVSYTSAMAPGVDPDLLHCCLLISKQAYPKCDELKSHSRVHKLATAVIKKLQQQQQIDDHDALSCIKQVLYQQEGYTRHLEHYFDPDSCYLNQVLDKKRGSPTSLAIIFLLVAQLCGVQLGVVSLPSHVLLYHEGHGSAADDASSSHSSRPGVFIDPYNDGAELQQQQVQQLVADNLAAAAVLTGSPQQQQLQQQLPLKILYGAAATRALLSRLLRSLREVFWAPVLQLSAAAQPAAQLRVQLERALSVLRLLRATEPDAQQETHVLDEAVCLVKLGRASEGAGLLQLHLAGAAHPTESALRVLHVLEAMLTGAGSGGGAAAGLGMAGEGRSELSDTASDDSYESEDDEYD